MQAMARCRKSTNAAAFSAGERWDAVTETGDDASGIANGSAASIGGVIPLDFGKVAVF
jgi:hypothetical protein